MSFLVGKAVQFVFNTGAVPGTNPIYPPRKHRTPVKAGFKYIVNQTICICNPAASLFFWKGNVQVRKSDRMLISLLFLHFAVIQTSSINSWRSSGLQTV